MRGLIKIILTFFMVCILAQSSKNVTFVDHSVTKYHIEFLNGNVDSVKRFHQRFPEIVKDRYVYIAYLNIYRSKKEYGDLLKSHLKK